MSGRDLVVIGASAGGVDALIRVVGGFPADLQAAVLVVLHVPADVPSNLASILSRSGPLTALLARDGMPLDQGRILCAPPDHHLAVSGGRVRVARGPFENLHRPSVDVLFRSAALDRGSRACGVILSGALDDGTSGMRTLKAAGAATIVQDPSDALVPSMPASVLEAIAVDAILPADEIGRRIAAIVVELPPAPTRVGERQRTALRQEVAMSTIEPGAHDQDPPGRPSVFGCPDCGGVLWEIDDGAASRFRCRVGHAYTMRALLAAEDAQLEDALWASLRALEEQETLTRRLLEREWAAGAARTRERLEERLAATRHRAGVIREFLLKTATPAGDDAWDEDKEEVSAG